MSSIAIEPLPIVVLRQASKYYGKGQNRLIALEQINCEIQDGEFVAVCGPSGSGKSTLLNLIAGIDHPTKGQVYLLNHDLTQLNDPQSAKLRAEAIGFVFQFFNLLPVLTVFDNVYYPLMLNGYNKKIARERVLAILERVGLLDHYKRLPSELSGGQQQRVAIARALVKQPKLVVADEPTGNLDSKTGQDIVELLKSINQQLGTTFVISTHSLSLRDQAKRVLDIADGKLHHDYHN